MNRIEKDCMALLLGVFILPAAFAQIPITKQLPSLAADVEMERVTRLLDGNVVTQRSAGRFYRDPQSRSRLEWGDQVTISDPVAKRSIIIDLKAKTARVTNLVGLPERRQQPTSAGAQAGVEPSIPGPASLGTQIIEGKVTLGKEYVSITPAGSPLGNSQPIKRVTRAWYSEELALPLLTTIDDPFAGVTTTRYRNLSVNQDVVHALFDVPQGFQVTQGTLDASPRNASQGTAVP